MERSQKNNTKDSLVEKKVLKTQSVEELKKLPVKEKGKVYLKAFLKNLNDVENV